MDRRVMPLQLECGVESPRASGLFAFEGFDVSVLKEVFLQKTFLHKTVIAICKTKKKDGFKVEDAFYSIEHWCTIAACMNFAFWK